ncbi:hypothetical protein VIGAN_07151300 [Vigna angularis var. angularis]|uniref:Uncharacterized protein n=1 Tax=Vigna angularis var. angularis TaxID=157739 RepID=A0A0S3SIL8_PHAAN|nr:hypothetical protein VIGAN_07151300 [Vigna angularis var. angularis]
MYKSWAQRRGYKVTLIDEMPGEIARIKVLLHTIFRIIYFNIILQFSKKSCIHDPGPPSSNVTIVFYFLLSCSMLLSLDNI